MKVYLFVAAQGVDAVDQCVLGRAGRSLLTKLAKEQRGRPAANGALACGTPVVTQPGLVTEIVEERVTGLVCQRPEGRGLPLELVDSISPTRTVIRHASGDLGE